MLRIQVICTRNSSPQEKHHSKTYNTPNKTSIDKGRKVAGKIITFCEYYWLLVSQQHYGYIAPSCCCNGLTRWYNGSVVLRDLLTLFLVDILEKPKHHLVSLSFLMKLLMTHFVEKDLTINSLDIFIKMADKLIKSNLEILHQKRKHLFTARLIH